MMPQIAKVVFDIGSVLCDFKPELRLEAMSRLSGLHPQRVHEAIWDSGLDEAADRGRFAIGDNLRAVQSALGSPVAERDLLEAWAAAFPANQALARIVGSLELQVAALTNNGPMFTACLDEGLIELPAGCSPIIYSWQLGALKPSMAAFNRAAILLAEGPARLLLVDDSATNVSGAVEAGWNSVLFEGPERLVEELRRLGVS